MGNVLVWIVWFVAAAACIGTGVLVVSVTNPFYSALSLIGNLASSPCCSYSSRRSFSPPPKSSSTQAR